MCMCLRTCCQRKVTVGKSEKGKRIEPTCVIIRVDKHQMTKQGGTTV